MFFFVEQLEDLFNKTYEDSIWSVEVKYMQSAAYSV